MAWASVFYAENRSFDNLYGLYPGANGIARRHPATWTQTDRDGSTLATLPSVWKTGAIRDDAYPANMANRPFRIDEPPVNHPLSLAMRDLIHRLHQTGADQRRKARPQRRRRTPMDW